MSDVKRRNHATTEPARKRAQALTPPPETGDVMAPNGCTLYWETGEQGRRYLTDEVGGGAVVWEVCLVDPSTLLAAIVKEYEFLKLEQEIKRRETPEPYPRNAK